MRHRLALMAAVVTALALPGAAHAATINLDSTGDLADAVGLANTTPAADTIVLAPGTYTPGGDGEIAITAPLTIQGAGAGATIIDGSGLPNRMFFASPSAGTVTFAGVRLTGAHSGVLGTAAPALVISDSQIVDNVGGEGGGVVDFFPSFQESTSVRVSGSTFADNQSSGAGALNIEPFNVGGIDAQITRSTFTRNTTRGGVTFQPEVAQDSARTLRAAAAPYSLVVTDSTFSGNVAQRGAGLRINPSWTIDSTDVVVARSTFAGNRAETDGEGTARGGGIDVNNATLTVENSTFSGNVADGPGFPSGGGGLAIDNAFVDLGHVTITGNRAEGNARGGGILGPIIAAARTQSLRDEEDEPVNITNSIVAGNTADGAFDDCASTFGIASDGGNLERSDTCGFDEDSDQQGVDPGLAPLASNGGPTQTHAIGRSSKAFNRGLAGECAATDQRGIPRPQFGGCDSGAYEAAPATQPAVRPPAVQPEEHARVCVSRRKFRIRVRVPRGEVARRVIVKVNGEKVHVKHGRRWTATVDLRGLPKARYKVEITVRLKGGHVVKGVRRYWTCTPSIRWTRPPKV